jgi:hypothetical protein
MRQLYPQIDPVLISLATGPVRSENRVETRGPRPPCCDTGVGRPALGYVLLHDLEKPQGPYNRRVVCDVHFVATKALSAYAQQALERGLIVA